MSALGTPTFNPTVTMNVISILATVIGILAAAGGAAGYFKASRGDSIIKYQATEIQLRDGTIANLEKTVATLSASNAAQETAIAELKRHNADLKEMSQGSPQLKELTIAVKNNTKAIGTLIDRERNK